MGCSVSEGEFTEAVALTKEGNMKVTRKLIKDWMLGPRDASTSRKANSRYWRDLSKVWFITEEEARRRTCANCEYSRNNEAAIEAMEHIPNNVLDADGGGRVWCEKFDFICHNLRTCQAWEY